MKNINIALCRVLCDRRFAKPYSKSRLFYSGSAALDFGKFN